MKVRTCLTICLCLLLVGSAPGAKDVKAWIDEFDFVTGKLETVYSYLETKQTRYGFSYTERKAHYRGRIRGLTSESEYRGLLEAFLKEFHDGHLKIRYEEQRRANGDAAPSPAVTHRWMNDEVLLTRIGRLWGDEEEIREQLRSGIRMAGKAKALIVDLRGNTGGSDAPAFEYISQLVGREVPLGKVSLRLSADVLAERPHYEKLYPPDPKREGFSTWLEMSVKPAGKHAFEGPIAVLIDKACYSSCEGAALAFKNSGIATIYGQATGGGSANPIFIDLPDTKGALMIPTWVQVMPDGRLLEDNGVPPDVELDGRIDALEYAIEALRKAVLTPRSSR